MGVPSVEVTGVTCAVNVTGCPATARVTELVTVVVVRWEATTVRVPGTSVIV